MAQTDFIQQLIAVGIKTLNIELGSVLKTAMDKAGFIAKEQVGLVGGNY